MTNCNVSLKENTITKENAVKSWDDISLPLDLLRGIYAYGFETPSPIQCKAILPMKSGRDIVAQAQSGTGKTATFTIGILSNIDLSVNYAQAMILSPTRELSIQIHDVVTKIGSMMNGLNVELCIGGTSVEKDEHRLLKNTPHVIVGCTGRVYDLLCRKTLIVNKIHTLVLDEADEMLYGGFKDQLKDIFTFMPEKCQFAFFSATVTPYMMDSVDEIMTDPLNIIVKKEALTLEGISQYYVALDNDHHKYETLKDLYSKLTVSQCIIYCNSVSRVQHLTESLLAEDFPVCCIHSNMDKQGRTKALQDFKNGHHRILISSDVTARGIDVQQVGIVINFDICKNVHTYLHRIGRSGRWGRKGLGINFVTRRDSNKMSYIESYYATQIQELPMDFTQKIV